MPHEDRPPYFPFYPDDFSSDGKVEAMSTQSVGAYTLLLCKAWKEDPPGTLPNNDVILARWCRMSEPTFADSKLEIMSPFALRKDDRWHQKRMELEFEKFRRFRDRQVYAGKIGAKKRWP